MAKEKKSTETKSAAKSPAPKKAAAPAKSKPAASGSPLIDTTHIAENAARMLSAGINLKKMGSASAKPESSLFKQLKSGLNKPHSAAMDNLLDKTHGPGANKTQGFSKQVAQNQTVGSDAARKSVPRRTAG